MINFLRPSLITQLYDYGIIKIILKSFVIYFHSFINVRKIGTIVSPRITKHHGTFIFVVKVKHWKIVRHTLRHP